MWPGRSERESRMPIQVRLIVVGGKASKAEVALKLPSVIGRSREAGLTVAHPMVSRRHCEVFEVDGLLMIRDLGSLNGTVCGGQRVKESPLPPDAEFTVGPLTFRAQYQCRRDLSKLPPPVLAEPDVAVTAPSAPPKPDAGARRGRRSEFEERGLGALAQTASIFLGPAGRKFRHLRSNHIRDKR